MPVGENKGEKTAQISEESLVSVFPSRIEQVLQNSPELKSWFVTDTLSVT